jgi:hypothetical protein
MTLPEIIAAWQQEARVADQSGRSDGYPRICEQTVEALRELQQLRAANHQKQPDSVITGQAQQEWCRTGRWPIPPPSAG